MDSQSFRTKAILFLLGFCLLTPGLADIESGSQKSPQTPNLGPGDFIWQPQASPQGPVVIIVDLAQQLLRVYRAGVEIGRSTISAGRDNYPTPTGIFTILQKNVTHHSNKYHEASMPFMERLTWTGLAIHAGNVPGHPESHGCVHVPMDFAKKLYGITHKGATVLITGGQTKPQNEPDLEFSRKGAPDLPPTPAGQQFTWKPGPSPAGPLSIIFSNADHQIYVYDSGVEIGRAQVQEPQPTQDVGDRIYAATAQTDAQGRHQWTLLGSLDGSPAPDAGNLLGQLGIPPPFLADMRQATKPGTTLVITHESVNKQAAREAASEILDTASQEPTSTAQP